MDAQSDVYAVLYAEIGRRVRERRQAKGMTQSELATAIGLTRTSVTNIEKGRQKLLVHTLHEIAAALGARPSDLMHDDYPTSPGKMTLNLPSNLSDRDRALIESAIVPAKRKGR